MYWRTIAWCNKEFSVDDNDSKMFPAIHFLVSLLSIEHLFKNIYWLKKLDQKQYLIHPRISFQI